MDGIGIMREGEDFEFDIPYIDGVYFPQFPGVMAREALIIGQRPPALDAPFVYCDMGCGTGGTLLMLAASFPESQFFGVDLSAAHIEQAEAARQAASVENVTFHCGSFGRMAEGDVPPCDFISAHGILSWIPKEAETELLSTVQALLKPGGLFQLSANLEAGWGQMTPLRRVLRHYMAHGEGTPGERLRTAIRKTVALVESDDIEYGPANPVARNIVQHWQRCEAAYVGHEMLAGSWRHFTISTLTKLCKSYGLDCCGPFESQLTVNAEKIAGFDVDSDDPATLEDFLCFAAGENFRSMIFMNPGEDGFKRDSMTLASTDVLGFPVHARWSEMTAAPETPLSDWAMELDDQPLRMDGILRAVLEGTIPEDDFHAIAKFIGQGLADRNAIPYAQEVIEVDTDNCSDMQFSVVHPLTTRMLEKPRMYRLGGQVPSPVLGGGVTLKPAQAALLRAYLDDAEDKVAYARDLIERMDPLGPEWALDVEGRSLPDPGNYIDDFTRDWLPFLMRLGVIQARPA